MHAIRRPVLAVLVVLVVLIAIVPTAALEPGTLFPDRPDAAGRRAGH